ncbi:MAG: acyltransferase family protein, partial [Ruminococcus sp.]|nr:acyltransferase family protein [Candidatus Copronaster equi]
NLKGFLIILVVFAHCLVGYRDNIVISYLIRSIYLFHMPAFIFVSGLFGKSERAQSPSALIKLVFAYFVFNCALGFTTKFENVLIPLYSYWYICALILWRATAKYVSRYKFAMPVLIVVGLVTGMIPQIDNTFGFARFISYYPFYLAGYLIPLKKINDVRLNKKFRIILCVSSLVIAVTAGFIAIKTLNCDTGIMLMNPYTDIFDIPKRITVRVAAGFAILFLIMLFPNRRIYFFNSFGKNSLSIYLIHRIFTIYFGRFISEQVCIVKIALSLVFCIALCIIFGNKYISGLVERYLDNGTELILHKINPEKKKAEYVLTALTVCAVACTLLLKQFIN